MTDQAFELFFPDAEARTSPLFLCDHASNALPEAYGTLGLPLPLLQTHIAWDIGAAVVTRALAASFGARAVLARWSRLLIDLNRGDDDPTLVMKLSDGSLIPGNARADDREVAHRAGHFHAPYHRAIEREIAALMAAGVVPALISVHSFTPVWKGLKRPWEVGVLWDHDARLARPMIERLAKAGFTVGDNEPYSGELENDCMYRHGTMKGLPHVLIEIRQDLITSEPDALRMVARLKPVIAASLKAMGTPAVRFTRPLMTKGRAMDEATRTELEAAVFRRLVAHLRERTDVQNIDLMIVADFCRNCLGDWYREAAAEKGVAFDKDEARAIVYGMSPAEWKTRYQKQATPEQLAAFERAQKTHK